MQHIVSKHPPGLLGQWGIQGQVRVERDLPSVCQYCQEPVGDVPFSEVSVALPCYLLWCLIFVIHSILVSIILSLAIHASWYSIPRLRRHWHVSLPCPYFLRSSG